MRFESHSSDPPGSEWRIHVAGSGLESTSAPFDPNAIPTAPLELQLPATGSIRSRYEFAPGASRASAHELRLHVVDGTDTMDDRSPRTRFVSHDGWTRFPHVALGKTFVVTGDQRLSTGPFRGPTVDGEEIEVELRPAPDRIVVIGRLLDRTGRPITTRDCRLEFEISGQRRILELTSDESGAFSRVLPIDCVPPATWSGAVVRRVVDRDEPQLHVLGARRLDAGVHDLGELRLESVPVVAAGRVVFVAGQRATNVPMRVERHVIDPRGNDRFVYADLDVDWTRDCFFVSGTTSPGRHRLVFPGQNHLPIEPVEFTPGDRDIVVKVDRGVAREVRVRLPDGVHREARGLIGVLGDAPHLVAEVADIANGVGVLRWPAVPTDVLPLEFRIRDLGPRLLSLPDVAAQTEIVDLREVVDVVSLRTKDRGEATAYLMPQPSERAWRGYPFREPVLQLFVPKGPAHVVVVVREQPPVELRNVRGEVLVEPGTWPEVEIVVEGVGELPPKHSLAGGLRTTSRGPEWRSPPSRPAHVVGGRVRLPMGPETSVFSLWLASHHGGPPIPVACEPSLVRPGVATFVVRVTEEAMQRARAEAAK